MTIQLLGLAAGVFSAGLDFPSLGRLASQVNRYLHIYGPVGLLIPFLASSEVFRLVEQVLWDLDDAVTLRFLGNQLEEINMVAVTGSVVAGVATSGLNLKYLSDAHWTARAFILASLLSGLFCVYYSMKQLRLLGALITASDVRDWLRSPRERIRCKEKNRPSVRAVLILDTPRTLVAMSAISYVVGLSVYLVCVYASNLDPEAGAIDSRKAMIFYFVALWFCLALYTKADLFDWYSDRNRTWIEVVLMLVTVRKLFSTQVDSDCEDELPSYVGGTLFPPLHQPKIQQIPSDLVPEGRALVASQPNRNAESPVTTASPSNDSVQTRKSGSASLEVPQSSIVSALDEAIASRQQCINADQKFLAAIQEYREAVESSSVAR